MCSFLLMVAAIPRAVSAQAQAGKASLSVCNRGTVTVDVVAVSLTSGLVAQRWEVEGTSIAPGACESTYEGNGLRQRVFLGFGFKNSRGQFVAGRVPTGKIWRVSTESGTPVAGTSNPNVLSAGTTLVFAVNGTDRAVAAGR